MAGAPSHDNDRIAFRSLRDETEQRAAGQNRLIETATPSASSANGRYFPNALSSTIRNVRLSIDASDRLNGRDHGGRLVAAREARGEALSRATRCFISTATSLVKGITSLTASDFILHA
jgi:hypothetical protein